MQQQIVVNGLLINYISSVKPGAQKCVLFLHGWRSNKEVWGQLISKLANQQISMYALDLPGFGGSQLPSRDFTIGDYAEVVAEFIKKLELKNVIVVGHSFGGRVGIKLSAMHPDTITKLVLVDSAGFADVSSRKNFYGAVAKIVKPFFKLQFMHGLRKKIYKQIGAEDYVETPEIQKTFVNVVNEDLTSDMKKIQCPTLIIFGENDVDTPPSFGKKMQSLIPNSSFLLLNNAGHFSFLDQPQKFVEILTESTML